MIVRRKIFEKYEEYKFNIPYQSGDTILVKSGGRVKKGDKLMIRRESSRIHSFFLPTEIDVPIPKLLEYLNCVDGEFVNKGDVLAQRVMTGGLSVKKIVSPAQGVIDHSRLNSGYLDLLGEENDQIVKSSFQGIIEGVDPIDGINITTDSYALDLLAISDSLTRPESERKVFGEFVTIGDGRDLLLHVGDFDCEHKIVFVGKYLHPDLLYDLFRKGVLFVLTYSMEYEEFTRQGLPVGIVGGFGEIYSSKSVLNLISSMSKKFVVVDYDENQMFFLTDEKSYSRKEELFVKVAVGSTVISRALSNYGMFGKVTSVEEEGLYINVNWEGGQRSIINIANVEFVSI